VAALGATDGADEAGLAEGGEELVEVRLGDVLARGDFGALDGPFPVVVGELDEGADAVITFG
jgi:hypothetical protein